MSIAASQRRDQRRQLGLAWNRSAPVASMPKARRPVQYASEALPERHPGLGTFLPTSLAGFALAATAFLLVLAATIGIGLWEAVAGGPVFGRDATRFAATFASMRRCLDVRSLESLGGWFAQLGLVAATVTALIVRLMRRHRRDEHQGRFRAWGCLALLFAVTSCAGQVPLGDLFANFVSDAVGVAIGPKGIGWWVLTAGSCYAVVGLWAILPLHERAATGMWLSACLAAWAAAAACGWLGEDLPILPRGLHGPIGTICWMAGGPLAAIAMLAAARSVLREVRGLPSRTANERQTLRAEVTQPCPRVPVAASSAAVGSVERQDGFDARGDEADSDRRHHGQTEFVDGGDAADDDEDFERSGRHLSKAERKRLRKLARMSRAA